MTAARPPRHTRQMSYEERCMHDGMLNARELLESRHAEVLDRGILRAGGSAVCASCGWEYYDHPSVVGALWAKELCDGRLVKL